MANVTVLLEEEYRRLVSQKATCMILIEQLPCGYISRKKIGKNIYYYRQWREGGKVKSAYIPKKSLDSVIAEMEHRRQLEAELKQIDHQLVQMDNSGLISISSDFKESIIRQVAGSMAIEGMILTEEDKDRIRNFAFDRTKIDSVVASLVKKHSAVRG